MKSETLTRITDHSETFFMDGERPYINPKFRRRKINWKSLAITSAAFWTGISLATTLKMKRLNEKELKKESSNRLAKFFEES